MNYVLVFDDAYSWYESQQLGLDDDFLETQYFWGIGVRVGFRIRSTQPTAFWD